MSFATRLAASNNLRFETDSWQTKPRNHMFILGMGFVGQFFAQGLKTQGWSVAGTCTSIMKKKKLIDSGFDIYEFDANEPETSILDVLKYHTHLVVSIPPLVSIGDPMLHHEKLLRSLLKGGNLRWLGYLSSTSMSYEHKYLSVYLIILVGS